MTKKKKEDDGDFTGTERASSVGVVMLFHRQGAIVLSKQHGICIFVQTTIRQKKRKGTKSLHQRRNDTIHDLHVNDYGIAAA
jgi:hypothetical protein